MRSTKRRSESARQKPPSRGFLFDALAELSRVIHSCPHRGLDKIYPLVYNRDRVEGADNTQDQNQ